MSLRNNEPRSNTGLLTKSFASMTRQIRRREEIRNNMYYLFQTYARVTARGVHYQFNMPRRVRRLIARRRTHES